MRSRLPSGAQAPNQDVNRETAPAWTTSASGSARPCARQPYSGTFFYVPTVEDRHIAAQEDIAEDPEGPFGRRYIQGLEAGQTEADATPSNLQCDKPGHWVSRPPTPPLLWEPRLRLAHYPGYTKRFCCPYSVLVRSHSQLHPLKPQLTASLWRHSNGYLPG